VLAAASAARAGSLPSVSSGARPGPDVLYAPAPAAPQLENRNARFSAPPLLVSGQEAYVAGEYLYQDFLYDDYGSDTDGQGASRPGRALPGHRRGDHDLGHGRGAHPLSAGRPAGHDPAHRPDDGSRGEPDHRHRPPDGLEPERDLARDGGRRPLRLHDWRLA